jgi:hypothetical protein
MPRFLSYEWFELARSTAEAGDVEGVLASAGDELVIEVVVSSTPEGDLRYQVTITGEQARVIPPSAAQRPAQVRFSSDYATLAGIAAGQLSTYDALLAGRARVSGDTAVLSAHQSDLAGLDLMPASLRTATTF